MKGYHALTCDGPGKFVDYWKGDKMASITYNPKTNSYEMTVEYSGYLNSYGVYCSTSSTKEKKKDMSIDNLIPERVIYNGRTTIVYFPDGDKIVVRCADGEEYHKENGVSAAIVKRLFGSRSKFLKLVESGYIQPEKENKK